MSNEQQNEMTQRVALFRNQRHDFCSTFSSFEGEDRRVEGYVRLSEWMHVEFKPLPLIEVTAIELAALAELRAKTVDEFTQKLSNIDGRMANLRALTGPVST